MNNEIRFLQFGGQDLRNKYHFADNIRYDYYPSDQKVPVIDQKQEPYDAAIFLESPSPDIIYNVFPMLVPYTVFYTFSYSGKRGLLAEVFKRTQAVFLPEEELGTWVEELPFCFWKGQYGDKLKLEEIVFSDTFHGSIRYEGHNRILLHVNAEEWNPVLTWRYNRVKEKDMNLEVWPELEAEEGVKIQAVVRLFLEGREDHLLQTLYFDLPCREPFPITLASRSYISLSYRMKGQGNVRVGAAHVRWSRFGRGYFLNGGKRYADHRGHEFFTYFHPGDLQPPLNVYFSGYRSREGFEGYHMLESLGAPFLLISDPRIEGGAYYQGSPDYEQAIENEIEEKLSELGFAHKSLILSGLSMGAYGALYYASRLKPHAVLLGKPLINGGNIAVNAARIRPDDFLTSLDVLQMAEGTNSPESAEQFNRKMLDRIQSADFSETTFAVVYMLQDDYDRTAYRDLLEILEKKAVRIYAKGMEGRHNDSTLAVRDWFLLQYRRIIAEDFGR